MVRIRKIQLGVPTLLEVVDRTCLLLFLGIVITVLYRFSWTGIQSAAFFSVTLSWPS